MEVRHFWRNNNKIAEINGLPVSDFSERDKKDLARTLLELKQEFGGSK